MALSVTGCSNAESDEAATADVDSHDDAAPSGEDPASPGPDPQSESPASEPASNPEAATPGSAAGAPDTPGAANLDDSAQEMAPPADDDIEVQGGGSPVGSMDASMDAASANDTVVDDFAPEACVAGAPYEKCDDVEQLCSSDDGRTCGCVLFSGDQRSWQCENTCPDSVPMGDCADAEGLVCTYGEQLCNCVERQQSDGSSSVAWECGTSPITYCPDSPPETGTVCSREPETTSPCVYPGTGALGEECRCTIIDGSSTWMCFDRLCPFHVPTGSCSTPGLDCAYSFPIIGQSGEEPLQRCECVANADSGGQWFCNDRPMPECPIATAESLNGTSCGDYVTTVDCGDTSGRTSGGNCNCAADKNWICLSSQPPMTE